MSQRKTRPSLGATITMNLVGGALAGYLVGSGIEDILHEFSINPPIEYMKTIISGIGALGLSTLGTLQYFNRDEHEGMLVMHVIEGQGFKKPEVKPQPNLEGLACAFEGISEGVYNRQLVNTLYSEVANNLQRNPFGNVRANYEQNKDAFLANSFDVFVPFNYNGRTINPKETLDKFFDVGEKLYLTAIEGLSNSAEKIVKGQDVSKNSLPNGFRNLLSQEVSLAQDIALWTTYLCKREGVVGSKVRENLAQYGITDPNYLAHDVKVLGQNILKLYDSK